MEGQFQAHIAALQVQVAFYQYFMKNQEKADLAAQLLPVHETGEQRLTQLIQPELDQLRLDPTYKVYKVAFIL